MSVAAWRAVQAAGGRGVHTPRCTTVGVWRCVRDSTMSMKSLAVGTAAMCFRFTAIVPLYRVAPRLWRGGRTLVH